MLAFEVHNHPLFILILKFINFPNDYIDHFSYTFYSFLHLNHMIIVLIHETIIEHYVMLFFHIIETLIKELIEF